jgi:hypothetical protein
MNQHETYLGDGLYASWEMSGRRTFNQRHFSRTV